MKNASFKGKLIKIESGAVSNGKNVDQDTFLQLGNGQVVSFFDFNCAVNVKQIGKEFHVWSDAFFDDPKPSETKEKKIDVVKTTQVNVSGQIIGAGEYPTIDCGAAIFTFTAGKYKYKIGEFVKFQIPNGYRIDILKMKIVPTKKS